MGENGGQWPDGAPSWAQVIHEAVKDTGRKVEAMGTTVWELNTRTAVQAEQIRGLREAIEDLPCEAREQVLLKIKEELDDKATRQELQSVRVTNRVLMIIGGALAATLAALGAKEKGAEVLRYFGGEGP